MSTGQVNELQPKEAVASVTRIPAPDVADKGAASSRLWDLDQPLLHGMESTAASNVARPGVGSSPAGCRVARLIAWLEGLHRRWYDEELARNRRSVEETARRFGGRVTWSEP